MGDLAQNVEAVFKKWEAKSRGRGSRHANYNSRQNDRRFVDRGDSFSFSKHSRNSRNNYRGPRYSNPSYESLAVFKMTPSVVPQRHSRPFVGIPCTKCVPFSKANIEDTTLYLLGIHNILSIPYISKEHFVPFNINWFWNLSRLHSITSDSSIGFLQSQRVVNTIKELVDKTKVDTDKDAIISEYHEKCQIIYNTIKATISSFCVGIVGFSLHCILKRIFDRIFFHKGQIEIIASLRQDGVPFIYLPLYRSYFDHLLVPYVLHMSSLQVPYTAVKKDLHVPFISYICRYLGVIFYDGKTSAFQDDDSLYEAILKNYIVHCTEKNGSSILFLEDSRSISGKPQLPSSDLLAPIIHSVAQGSIEDAYIVPVSVSYEKIEGNYVTEQLGTKPKEHNIISRLHSLWKMIHFKYGNVRVNFSQPFSVQEFLKSCNRSNSSMPSGYCENSNKESSIEKLAHHVIYDATSCTSLMISHLLAFLLVTQYRNGGTQQQLQSSLDWLRSEIIGKKWDVGFTGESLPVINRAIEILGKDLVTTETIEMEWTSSDLENNNVKVKLYTPTVKLPHILELRYYANTVVPLFLKESIIVNALYAIVDVEICHFHHCDSRFYVSRDELIETATKLIKYLKYEFIIVPPCEDIVNVFNDVIDALIEKECLSLVNMGDHYTKSRKHLSFASSDEEDFEDLSRKQQLKVDLQEESINHLEFLRQILSPYIESYWLAACSLLQLINEIKEESVFIQEMQMTAQDKLYKGLLAYEESFSADTFKNALKVFQDQSIIHSDCEDNVKIVYLTEQYNSLESINCVIGEIEDFRK